MRIVLLALLFQFVSPVFLPVVTQAGTRRDNHTTVQVDHRSVILPQLLKEKEETEYNSDLLDVDVDYVPLFDFASHSLLLTQLHEGKFTSSVFQDTIAHQPPLFTLYHTFLI